MRLSIKRPLTALLVVGALALGGVGEAMGAGGDNANGPDAGIGIPGYNLDYEHSADGSGPGYPRYRAAPEHQYQGSYQKYGPHYYRPY